MYNLYYKGPPNLVGALIYILSQENSEGLWSQDGQQALLIFFRKIYIKLLRLATIEKYYDMNCNFNCEQNMKIS